MAQKRRWSWRRQVVTLQVATTLANWRWRQQWFLLLMTGLGITAAIIVVSSLPLCASVMNTAGLRGVLRAQPTGAQLLTTNKLDGLSSHTVANATQRISNIAHQDIGSFLAGTSETEEIETGDCIIMNSSRSLMHLYGAPLERAASHIQLLKGRMPQPVKDGIEIILTRASALSIGNLQVGDTLGLNAQLIENDGQPYELQITVHVAGIFQTNTEDPFWDGSHFENPPPVPGEPATFLGLTSNTLLLSFMDQLAAQKKIASLEFSPPNVPLLYSSYDLDTPRIAFDDLNALIARLGTFKQDMEQRFNNNDIGYFYDDIASTSVSGPAFHDSLSDQDSTLENYRQQTNVAGTPALLLTLQIVCLILFFISVMASALVERQQGEIAVMRSRGATTLQVCGSLFTQGLLLCLSAGLAGPLLTILLVSQLIRYFLPPSLYDAANALWLHFWSMFQQLEAYNLVALVISLGTMGLTFFFAVRANILTLRHEEARSTRQPLWQRLRLDLLLGLVALAGYAVAFYLESSARLLDAPTQSLISTPLELLAPLLLIIAAILFFMRFFPLLLHWLARWSLRRRGLSSTLALVQMERAPRRAMRMALLLGLATAFALFSLVFAASQSQRALDMAAYQVGSDFSGYIPQATDTNGQAAPGQPAPTLARLADSYKRIKGVSSVTTGYVEIANIFITDTDGERRGLETQLRAVDAETFARTARWSPQDSDQSLAALMQELISARRQALTSGTIPAFVTSSTWQLLNLHVGQSFHLSYTQGNPNNDLTFIALGQVEHLPPVNDAIQAALLVDYQTLASARMHIQEPITPNYIWLRTTGRPGDLASIRQMLSTSPTLQLENVLDYYTLSQQNSNDPLALHVLMILSSGVVATLLLALLATVLLPLLELRTRTTTFAVLRALGTVPAQVTSIFSWEQAMVLLTAGLLGLIFGALLIVTAVQPLVFTGVLATDESSVSGDLVYSLQHIVPVSIVLPPSLVIVAVVLLFIFLLALLLLSRLARRPLMGQVLRLSQD